MELPDGSALILSVAKYAGPDGKKIQDEAVQPNVVVASSQDADDDEDASNGPKPGASPNAPKTDDQLDKALTVLRQKSA
jgi:carboxyl-terminal processing protease